MFSNLLSQDNIVLELQSNDKDEVFSELVEFLVRKNPSVDRNEALSSLYQREEQGNTCTSLGIAVPHACLSSLKQPEIVIGLSKSGIDYEVSDDLTESMVKSKKSAEAKSLDKSVHLVIMIFFGVENTEAHLHILSDCAQIINSPNFYPEVLSLNDKKLVLNAIKEAEYGRIGN